MCNGTRPISAFRACAVRLKWVARQWRHSSPTWPLTVVWQLPLIGKRCLRDQLGAGRQRWADDVDGGRSGVELPHALIRFPMRCPEAAFRERLALAGPVS